MMNYFFKSLVLAFVLFDIALCGQWPIPYKPVASRPTNDPYCQAGLVPFCPSGKTVDSMPVMDDDDTIEVFALKKPVWSFKYGPLLGYFHIMHDGLGVRSKKTGLNYTMEWYELDQLFNSTFPHVLQNNSFLWCNQGALCVYDGINDTVWTEYGTLQKVSEINGTVFNSFSNWAIADNNTKVFYETWTIYDSNVDTPTANRTMYFDSFDCASWVLRSLDSLYSFGAVFDTSIKLNYTRLELYAHEPIRLGNYSQIINSGNETLIDDMIEFYKSYQKRTDYLEQAMEIIKYFVLLEKFYFFYNEEYWLLSLKKPLIRATYNLIPLPGTFNRLLH